MPLRLLLPPIDRPGADTRVEWCIVDARGASQRSGQDRLSAIPRADGVELILPASRVLHARLKLPKVGASTLRELLPYAVEDQLLADPAQVHAVTGATLASGETIVAIVDRSWLEAGLGWVAAAGLRCNRAICETALAPAAPGCWHARLTPSGAWLAEDNGHAVAFDAPGDGEPPFAVRIAVSEARERGSAPTVIRVWSEASLSVPDAAAWRAALAVDVQVSAPPAPLTGLIRSDAIDLLTGDLAHREPRAAAFRLPRHAWVLAATVLALLGGLLAFDVWRLDRERRALVAEQESLFRTAFPEAKTVVDPALQLRRNLEGLRRSRGEASTSEFLAAAAEAARSGPVPAKKLTYAQGKLEVDRAAPPSPAPEPAK
jgi:general secretion pathway protein L